MIPSKALAPALLLLSMLPAGAHHSLARFDLEVELTMQGTVTRFDYVNPHSWLHVDVANEDGSVTEWRFELDAPVRLEYLGVRQDFFQPGDTIKVKANPSQDGSLSGYLAGAVTTAGRTFGDTEGIDD